MSFTSRSGLLLLMWLALTAPAAGQQTAKQLLEQAYAKTKSAKTSNQYTAIIELCEQAQESELTPSSNKYARQLLGWAFNRRGEAFVEQAASALEAGESNRAAELDAQALADFEAAIEHDPQRWKAVHNRGVSRALTGKYRQAIEDFSRVLELKPEYVNAIFNRGEIHYELEQYAEAVEDYGEVLRMQPDDLGALTGRGHAYLHLRKFSLALADYTRATELDDQHAAALAGRGNAYQQLENWEQAAADFRQAIKLDPDSASAYRAAAWLMATCPDERFRNAELGVQAAERAWELSSVEDAPLLDALAAAYANAGRYEEAAETLAEAIQLAAGEAEALRERLELYRSEQPYRQPRRQTARATGTGRTD